MKAITLQTAVILAVNELLACGSFSAYEVTVVIRNRVDNDYTISDITEKSDSFVAYTIVPHGRVRDIVVELFDNDLFQATKSYGNIGGVSYTIYNAVDSATPVAQPTTQVAPQVTPVSVDPIFAKIEAYLAANGAATIKKIQSALKINGLLCEDIAKLIPTDRAINLNVPISKVVVNP
jgi:hypothetical protein